MLGIDVLLDSKAQPWLIEMNDHPSFRIDLSFDEPGQYSIHGLNSIPSPVDEAIKVPMLTDALRLVGALHRLRSPKQPRRKPGGAWAAFGVGGMEAAGHPNSGPQGSRAGGAADAVGEDGGDVSDESDDVGSDCNGGGEGASGSGGNGDGGNGGGGNGGGGNGGGGNGGGGSGGPIGEDSGGSAGGINGSGGHATCHASGGHGGGDCGGAFGTSFYELSLEPELGEALETLQRLQALFEKYSTTAVRRRLHVGFSWQANMRHLNRFVGRGPWLACQPVLGHPHDLSTRPTQPQVRREETWATDSSVDFPGPRWRSSTFTGECVGVGREGAGGRWTHGRGAFFALGAAVHVAAHAILDRASYWSAFLQATGIVASGGGVARGSVRQLQRPEADLIFLSTCGKGGSMGIVEFFEACATAARKLYAGEHDAATPTSDLLAQLVDGRFAEA